jgi:uncharacterized membrane protein
MNQEMLLRNLIRALAILVAASSLTGFAEDQYRVTRIVPTHGDSALPRGLNASGQAVGSSGQAHGSDPAAFFAQRGGRASTLFASSDSDYSEAFAINDLGVIVGSMNTSSAVRAARFSSGGARQLPLPAGMNGSEAFAINNSGAVAGYVSGPAGMQAAIWNPDDSVRLLGSLEKGQLSEAAAISAGGDVAGWLVKDGLSQAFLWTASTGMTLLPGSSGKAHGINDSRFVVGSCSGTEVVSACLWTPDGVQNLGTLFGGDYTELFDINNAGTAVGAAGTPLGMRATTWNRADGLRDLNSLISPNSGIVLSSAVAINERGEILAYGSVNHDLAHDRPVDLDHGAHSGPTFMFLLTPTR